MGKADLHIHSIHSWDGTGSVSVILKFAANQAGLDVIALTDHDQINGALEAQQLAPGYGIDVIPGVEVTTAEGHLLALFVSENIPPQRSLVETLERVGEQGGVCIFPHPAATGASSLPFQSVLAALQIPALRSVLLGIEAFNAGLFDRRSNLAASAIAQLLPLARVGSSDSHVVQTIGEGATDFPGRSAADLRAALAAGLTQPLVSARISSRLIVAGNWLPRFLLNRAGLTTWFPTPDARRHLGLIKTMKRTLLQTPAAQSPVSG